MVKLMYVLSFGFRFVLIVQQLQIRNTVKRTRDLFGEEYCYPTQQHGQPGRQLDVQDPLVKSKFPFEQAESISLKCRIQNEYAHVQKLPPSLVAKQAAASTATRKKVKIEDNQGSSESQKVGSLESIVANGARSNGDNISSAMSLRKARVSHSSGEQGTDHQRGPLSTSLVRREHFQQAKPDWHAPWKLMRVISGHLGWVRALAVEPGNQWFASGAGDRTIKIWDLASGSLRLTLTGHISSVRGLAVSSRHPYLFSCGEDKMVKCWDLETNKVIRHYHGHLSGVYTLSIHPTLDVLVTGGRDGVARVWDMRTRSNIHVLSGHKQTVTNVQCQEADPQVITSSLDSTVRLWDLAAGKTMGVLTHHKKGVRALAIHPKEFTFASASTGSIKQWKCPEGTFMQNFEGQNSVINTLSVNEDNVLFSGGR